MGCKIVYLAHDLSDPAVARRIRMLVAGGATVQPIGFRRSNIVPQLPCEAPPIDLGRTSDGKLGQRIISVLQALLSADRYAKAFEQADAVIARNLEMLTIASKARSRYVPSARLIYECLDIHGRLLSRDVSGTFLRALETRLWRRVDLLLTSSPAFIAKYFEPRGFPAPIRLVENKLALLDGTEHEASPRPPPGPPWRIGWFGSIRCRESLDILNGLATTFGGRVEIVIRGRPSEATFPDFARDIEDLPHVHYGGPYRNPDDLSLIYGGVHFNWAVDYYESGQNSAWLLPNRLYEGTYYGAVPIALAGVATGEWLATRGLGVVLNEPMQQSLADFFASLDNDGYDKLVRDVQSVPRARFVSDRADCQDLVQSLCRPRAEPSGVPLS